MTEPNVIESVERAQRGDAEAFRLLVARFQDLAVATAYGWLGDAEAARDVAQEAFLEAHRNLVALREPAAFPGWFRRIVIKHCDRVTRRGRMEVMTPAGAASAQGPETIHAASEEAERLRFAVDALPPGERIVVALQYFAEATGEEVSTFLELPLSTIKRRLRRARQRLRETGDTLMAETIDSMRPSNTGGFAREIAFFIALRAVDRPTVSRLLEEAPELLEAFQDWDSGLVQAGVLPFASKATPLITAIERGDLQMQTLLLDAGANVDGVCGCATGEAPIWAAAVMNRLEHARLLLQRGADPNVVSSCGNCALHVAAMRGQREMVELLLAYGADPRAVDRPRDPPAQWVPVSDGDTAPGRSPAAWAEANGHDAVARLLGAADAGELATPDPAGGPLAETIHTGIKALDLFAPLVRGGVTRFPFMAGVGMVVLLAELCHRFLATEANVLWTGFTQPPFDYGDWEGEMAETGLRGLVEARLAGFDESPSARREAFARGLDLADSWAEAGRDVFAVILSTQGFENEVESSLIRLKAPRPAGSVTSIVVTPFGKKHEGWDAYPPPYSGQIALDYRRARQRLFPAIDPRRSGSCGLASDLVGERHVRLAERCRSILEQYENEDPEFERVADDRVREDRGPRLASYLCQPFAATEPFTGLPGEHVTLDDLLDGVEAIIES